MPFDINSYLYNTMMRESSGNQNAKAPTSSASGLYQFTTPTYLGVARKLNPGLDDQSLLAQKNDPNTQNSVMRAFTQQNVDFLSKNGLPVSNGSVYLSHFLGAGGAKNVLSADDNTPISQVVSPDQYRANKSVFDKAPTVGALKQWAEGGQAVQPANPMQAAMGAPQADMPVEGGQETSQQTGQDGFAPPPGPQSTWDKILAGGPGALMGAPQQGWNAGDALTGAGIAMMARDNPQGAAALSMMMKNQQRDARVAPNKQVFKVDEKTGKAFVMDPTTGKIEVRQVTDPQPKTIDPTSSKLLDGYREKADVSGETLDKYNYWRSEIANGNLDLSLANRVGSNISEFLNNTHDAKERHVAEFLADMEHMRNQKLLLNKGVQTEGDAERAYNEILPGLSKYDNKTVLSLLDRGSDDLRKSHDRYYGYASGIIKNHADGDPDKTWSNQATGRQQGWDSWGQTYNPRRDQFMNAPAPGTASGSTTTGIDPAKQHKQGGAFLRGYDQIK